MNKFKVSVHGKHFQINIISNRLFRTKYSSRMVGFYTTRFVEAETANEAIEIVFALVMSDLEKDGRVTPESSLELEEIREDEEGFDVYAAGEGYTFYGEAE
jgi:hypothetical protein